MRIETKFYEKIKKEAIKNNLTVKDFITISCLKNIDDEDLDFYFVDDNNVTSLLYQIRKIGVNINQIAKKINSLEVKEYNFVEFDKQFENIRNEISCFINHFRKVK